ncbi:hypothetical protein FD724_35790 (plasmid) [Nostoc sp. C057]|jgi:hypothetical protein|uniref:hypothetical protein n=1 Tax=Nostoc sp. C057 TaxID=2576903 RepID=UPI0015C36701|nr:hypothetical protein [Nostoc sp. C057]QLE53279.1 hypothetical protein FD724_35790 [Nostoc sp. C057]
MNSRVTSFGNGSRLAFIKDSKNQPIESIEETERNIFTDIDYKYARVINACSGFYVILLIIGQHKFD